MLSAKASAWMHSCCLEPSSLPWHSSWEVFRASSICSLVTAIRRGTSVGDICILLLFGCFLLGSPPTHVGGELGLVRITQLLELVARGTTSGTAPLALLLLRPPTLWGESTH